jgi:5-methylcytosine-specific restriction endonuclease McrBC regulatory subunit McrC
VVWNRYITESLASGRWGQIPCRYPDLTTDPILRRITRWALERLRLDLALAGGTDMLARVLCAFADDLLRQVGDVSPLQPSRHELDRIGTGNVLGTALSRGLEALGWISDERGLGGGRERDGLAWTLSLPELWEQYVEALVRREAAMTGGIVRVARRRETHFPLEWTDPSHRSLGHLAPDIVVTRGNVVQVIDAKYKAHLSELDEHGWRHFTDDAREAHRADIHQILAYASLYAADEIHATLMYPLRGGTYEVLRQQGRDRSQARLFHGARAVHLELRGVPFGDASTG